MTLEQRLIAFAQLVGADIKSTLTKIGTLTGLTTTDKTSLVAAINEIKAAQASASGINDTTPSTTSTYSSTKINSQIAAEVAAVVDGAPAAFNTLKELSDALAGDDTAINGLLTAVGLRVAVDAPQSFTDPQKAQARSNISALSAVEIGNPDADLVAAYNTAKA